MGILSFGYGCYIDSLKLKDGYEKELEKLFPKQIEEEFEEVWEETKECCPAVSKDEFLKDFVDEYCSPSGATGIEVLLADMINCRSFNEKQVVRGEEMILYSQPLFAETESEKAEMPILSEVENAMKEVLNAIAKDPDKIELKYYYFEEL